MIGPLLDMFTGALFIFSSVTFLNTCKPRSGWHSAQLGFYGSGLASLPSWLGMVNTGWLSSIRSEIFLQMKFIIFQRCPIRQAVFLPGQPAPCNHFLFSHFSLFQNAILHKMLKLEFWNLSLFSSEWRFHWLQHVFL